MVDKTPAELDVGTSTDTSVVHSSENDISVNSKKHNERDISRLQGTSPLYSSSKTYNVNDIVTESDLVYRCISSIAVPETFNIANWTEINAEDVLITVRNISGSMISKGSAVYISGEDSGLPTIDLALASGTSTLPSIGLVQNNIPNNNNGQVVYIGNEVDLNTSTFTAGDILFLSATTLGALTATAPSHPNLQQRLGVVLVSDVSSGVIEVLTGDVSGAEIGTISNSFAIGDGLAGTKTLSFVNDAGTLSVDAIPTDNRTQSLQDADGIIALTSDVIDTTASNVGSGDGVFKQKVGSNLQFKSLITTTPLNIANNSDDLTFTISNITNSEISATAAIEFSKLAALTINRALVSNGSGVVSVSTTTDTEIGFVSGVTSAIQTQLDSKVDTVTNLGAGQGVGASVVGDTLNLKSLVAGTNIGLVSTANDITISSTGDITTASNVGTGADVFKQKVLDDLEFRTILGADDIVISELTNEVEISAPDLRRRFTSKRQMTLHFGTGTIPSSDGLGAGVINIEGDQTAMLDADGYYVEEQTTGGMGSGPSGYIVTDSVRRDLNFDVTIKFRLNTLTDTLMYLGFFDNDPLTVALASIEHFALILQSDNANVNFRISHSDGITQGTTQVALQDTSIHTVRLVSDESNTQFLYSFDGAALTAVTTNIPAATTNLDLYLEVEDIPDAGIANWDFWYLDGFCDK